MNVYQSLKRMFGSCAMEIPGISYKLLMQYSLEKGVKEVATKKANLSYITWNLLQTHCYFW